MRAGDSHFQEGARETDARSRQLLSEAVAPTGRASRAEGDAACRVVSMRSHRLGVPNAKKAAPSTDGAAFFCGLDVQRGCYFASAFTFSVISGTAWKRSATRP